MLFRSLARVEVVRRNDILKAHGIKPAPERKRQTTRKTLLTSHWNVLAVIDFTTLEVWSKGGLVTWYLLFVIEIAASGTSPTRWSSHSWKDGLRMD